MPSNPVKGRQPVSGNQASTPLAASRTGADTASTKGPRGGSTASSRAADLAASSRPLQSGSNMPGPRGQGITRSLARGSNRSPNALNALASAPGQAVKAAQSVPSVQSRTQNAGRTAPAMKTTAAVERQKMAPTRATIQRPTAPDYTNIVHPAALRQRNRYSGGRG